MTLSNKDQKDKVKKLVSVRSDENLHFHGTSYTSKMLYHLQISEIFTSSKNENLENC